MLADEAPLPEKIRRVIHDHLHDLQTRRDCMIVFTEQRHHLSAEQQVALHEQGREYQSLLLKLFEEARTRHELRSDVDCQLAARALSDLCHGAALWLQRDPAHDLGHITAQYTRLFCAGIQG
ncbi:hypothetical protein D3C78_937420 [compost metagenome]